MDAWMENLPILKDFSPYQGRRPKRKKKSIMKSSLIRVSLVIDTNMVMSLSLQTQ